MAVKKFFSNKAKPGWRLNPSYKSVESLAGGKQKEHDKKYFSYGFDIDLETIGYAEDGKPKRNRRRESGFATRQLAEAAAARLKHSEKEDRYSLKKVVYPLLIDILKAGIKRLVNKKEQVRATGIFNFWLDILPPIRLDELRTSHINLFVEAKRDKIQDASINRELNSIASALHSAYKDFPVLENWIPPRIPRLKVKRSRRERIVAHEEFSKMIEQLFAARFADETQRAFENRYVAGQVFVMTLLTGARLGEICRMRWEHIDWRGEVLQIHGTKTEYVSASVVRYLRLSPQMREILLSRKSADRFGDYVFCRTGKSVTDYHQKLKEAAKRAGVKYGKNIKGGFVGHDNRHTAVTLMVQQGMDLSTVGSITGHADKTLVLHYAHSTPESIGAAGKVLDDFVASGKSET